MKYYIIALLILFNAGINAQNGFEVLISTDQHEQAVQVIEDYHNNYIIVGKREIFDLDLMNGYALKLSKTGEILTEKEFALPDTVVTIASIVLLPDSNYLLICKFGDDTVQSIMSIKTSDSFVEIGRRYHPMPTEYSWLQETKEYLCNNYIYLFGQVWNSGTRSDMYIYKMSYECDSIDSEIFQMNFEQAVWAILDMKNNSGFNFYCHGFFQFNDFTKNDSPGTLVSVDSLFNIISVEEIPGGLVFQNTAKWYNESEYLLTGRYYSSDNTLTGILKLDTADNILASNYLEAGPDTASHLPPHHSVDYISEDDIFFANIINLNAYQYPYQEDPSWIMLAKLDSNLNVKWQRYYGGDAFYYIFDIKATSDGGCIMAGIRYDHAIQDQEWDIYILKVDGDGLITSIDDQSHIPVSEAILYPNPGNDMLFIRTALADARVELYDLNGRFILSREIKNHFETVNTSSIPSAGYVYRIYRNAELIQNGIWIKK